MPTEPRKNRTDDDLAGWQNRFAGEIPIGAPLRRESSSGELQIKQGRSGRFALIKVEHCTCVVVERPLAVIDHQDCHFERLDGNAEASGLVEVRSAHRDFSTGRLLQCLRLQTQCRTEQVK